MVRSALATVALAILLLGSGCTMCCHPYDYCGPVYDGGYGCDSCGSTVRAGSILGGGQGIMASTQVPTVEPPSPPQRQTTPARSENSGRTAMLNRASGQSRIAMQNRVAVPSRTAMQSRMAMQSRTTMQNRTAAQGRAAMQSRPGSAPRVDPRMQARTRVPTPARRNNQAPDGAPTQASMQSAIQAETRPDDVPGSQKIVSVTDRVVGPSLTADAKEAADSTEAVASSPVSDSMPVAAESQPAAPKPLAYQGWTARRPGADVVR